MSGIECYCYPGDKCDSPTHGQPAEPDPPWDLIGEIYDAEGCRIWWHSQSKVLGDSPVRLWQTPEGRERVNQYLNALADGNF